MIVTLEINKGKGILVRGVEGGGQGDDIPELKNGMYYSFDELFSGSWRIVKGSPHSTCYFVIDDGAGSWLVIPYPC